MARGSNKTPHEKLKRYYEHYKGGCWSFFPLCIIVLGLAAATLAKNHYGSRPVGILAWNIVLSILTPLLALFIHASTKKKLIFVDGTLQKADTPVLSYCLLCLVIVLWTTAFIPLGVIIANIESDDSFPDIPYGSPSMPENIYGAFNQGGIGSACAVAGAGVMLAAVEALATLTLATKNAKECWPNRISQV